MCFPPQGFGRISLRLKRESRRARNWTPDPSTVAQGRGEQSRTTTTTFGVTIPDRFKLDTPQLIQANFICDELHQVNAFLNRSAVECLGVFARISSCAQKSRDIYSRRSDNFSQKQYIAKKIFHRRDGEFAESEYSLCKISLLRALRVSAVRFLLPLGRHRG
jgi:hypothetical protein